MTEVDHLVVAAATLDDGVRWCEATLGVAPCPGGAHALMGTHNRVLNVSSERFARCYLEIIAIDPAAEPPAAMRRWFDLDDPALQQRLRECGPQLVHWVARGEAIDALARRLDVGAVREASRGDLRWRISVREDGRRLDGGARPALIDWGGRHPCDTLPASGIALRRLEVGLGSVAFDALGVRGARRVEGDALALAVGLDTPRGHVRITS